MKFFRKISPSKNSAPAQVQNRSTIPKHLQSRNSVLAVLGDVHQTNNMVCAFKRLNRELAYTRYIDLAIETLIEHPNRFSFVILGIERAKTTKELLDFVEMVRWINPKLPIAVLSKDVKVSDTVFVPTVFGDAFVRECSDFKILSKKFARLSEWIEEKC